MQDSDWPAAREIYREGISTGDATFETEVPELAEWAAAHLRHSRLAGRHGGAAGGWAALSSVSHRAVYAGVAEVSIYVARMWRGQGLGRNLPAALWRDTVLMERRSGVVGI